MPANVLVISSSPRAGGNTELLAEELIKGAQSVGAQTEKINPNWIDLRPCCGCAYCEKHGVCRIGDDMRDVYPKLTAYHRIAFVSPIYFMAHCAQAKMIIDRCQVFWSRKYVLKQQLLDHKPDVARKGAFVACGGTRGKKVFEGAKLTMKYFFDVLEMEYSENLLFNNIDKMGDIIEHPTAMKDAFELGVRLAQP